MPSFYLYIEPERMKAPRIFTGSHRDCHDQVLAPCMAQAAAALVLSLMQPPRASPPQCFFFQTRSHPVAQARVAITACCSLNLLGPSDSRSCGELSELHCVEGAGLEAGCWGPTVSLLESRSQDPLVTALWPVSPQDPSSENRGFVF